MSDKMRWFKFRWFRLRRKLHYVGWHGKMCRSYKSFPIRENRPRCEVTGKFCRPSKLQIKYNNSGHAAKVSLHGE